MQQLKYPFLRQPINFESIVMTMPLYRIVEGRSNTEDEKIAKALMQKVYGDFLKR